MLLSNKLCCSSDKREQRMSMVNLANCVLSIKGLCNDPKQVFKPDTSCLLQSYKMLENLKSGCLQLVIEGWNFG